MSLPLPNAVEYRFDYTLLPGTFMERPNRFVSILQLGPQENSQTIKAHVPDPGRLKELLIPGTPVLIRDYGEDTSRKLRYSLEMVYSQSGQLVSVNTQLPNRLVGQLLSSAILPGFSGYSLLKREFQYEKSRIDFLLKTPNGENCLLEVKSCTLVEDLQGIPVALFPDAPTERGARHLLELAGAARKGYRPQVLFIIQRKDAEVFSPNARTDPGLTEALKTAMDSGVTVQAYCFELSPEGCRFDKEVPIVFHTF